MLKKRSLWTLVLSATLTLGAGAAFAQDDDDDAEGDVGGEEATEGTEGTEGDVGGDTGGDATAGDVSATADAGVYTKANWPSELTLRPLVLGKGMIEARGGLSYARITILDTSASATGLALGAGYGVTDKIEAGLSTGLGIDPEFDWSKSIGLYGNYLVIDQAKLDVAAGISTALNFQDGADVLGGFSINAPTRFLINDKIFVFGGDGLVPIGISDPSSVSLNLNVGAGFQATPKLAVTLDTQIVHLKLTGDANATTSLADFIPIGLRALFAVNNQLDAQLILAFPDVANAGDFMTLFAGVNYRL